MDRLVGDCGHQNFYDVRSRFTVAESEVDFQLHSKIRTADGSSRDMDMVYTWIRASGREMMTYIVFNDEGTEPVMGRLALNSLLLTVDPVARKLVPMTNILI